MLFPCPCVQAARSIIDSGCGFLNRFLVLAPQPETLLNLTGEPTHVFAAGVVMDSFDPVSKHLQAFEGVPGNKRSWFAAHVRICTNIAAKAS